VDWEISGGSMREVYLYMCDSCEVVKALGFDYGNNYFTRCETCNIIQCFLRLYLGRNEVLYKEVFVFRKAVGGEEANVTKDSIEEK
jgi:hypothetical protein